jgi:hypothetical protein
MPSPVAVLEPGGVGATIAVAAAMPMNVSWPARRGASVNTWVRASRHRHRHRDRVDIARVVEHLIPRG